MWTPKTPLKIKFFAKLKIAVKSDTASIRDSGLSIPEKKEAA